MAKSKKSSKTTSRTKSSFLSKLIPRSSKARLIIFLVVFAIIGGGYYAYSSSAASANFSVTADAGTMAVRSGATIVTETKGSKKKPERLARETEDLRGPKALIYDCTKPVTVTYIPVRGVVVDVKQ